MPYFQVKNKGYFFLHLPKTGGNTIETVFKNYGGEGIGRGHEYLKEKPKAFSFCVLRNPLDRLVSVFHYLKRGGMWQGDMDDAMKYDIINTTFTEWVDMVYLNPNKYFRQQHIEPISNRILNFEWIDRYLLFDNFDVEIKQIFNEITGEKLEKIPKINYSIHDSFMNYYDECSSRKVHELYEQDFVMYEKVKNETLY